MNEQKLKIYKCEFVNNYVSFTKNVIMYDCNGPMRLVYSFECLGIPLVDNSIRQDYNLNNCLGLSAFMAYELDPKPIELDFTELYEVYGFVKREQSIWGPIPLQKRLEVSIQLLELIMFNYNE